MKFVILAALIILVIAFFVVIWKAAQNWRWYNIVAACITMLLAVTLLFPTAGALKSRNAWHEVKETLEARAEKAAADQKLIKFGDPTDPSTGEGVVSLAQKLAKVGGEAGRRWRSLRMQNTDGGVITLTAPPPPAPAPGAEAPEPPTTPLIPETMVVYGFAEGQMGEVEALVPTFYLGEFQVTTSTPTQVQLTPTGPLEAAQQDAISQNKARSWSLYELLPLDAHLPFIAAGSQPDNDNLFGRVDDEVVKKGLQTAARLLGASGASPELQAELAKQQAETLKNYLRNGTQAEQDDPPVSRWVKLEFVKNHEIEVDSEDERGALEGGFFDGGGRAVDSRLKHGDGDDDRSVKFKTGDQITVKEEYANELLKDGVAKLINRYYVRPLNDYRSVLRRIRLRLAELSTRQKELEFEQKVLQDAIAATDKMLGSGQADKLNLEQDVAQYTKERESLQDHNAKLQSKVTETRKVLTQLYQQNQQLVERLKLYHHAISSNADALTAVQ